MKQVNMHDAKSTLSKLVAAAEYQKEETLLCRAGRPVAKITPISDKTVCMERKSGFLSGQIDISANFDEFLPAEAAIFGISVPK